MKHPSTFFSCLFAATGITLWLTIAGCSSSDQTGDAAELEEGGAETDVAGALRSALELDQYYASKVSIPPEEFEARERNEITQEEMDAKIAAGAYPKFFRFASPEKIPGDLVWENGADLPDIGSPKAKTNLSPIFGRTRRRSRRR